MNNTSSSQNEVSSVLAQDSHHKRRGLISFVVITIILIALYLFWPSSQKSALQFTTTPITLGDLTIQVTATGTLAPLNQVEVGSEVSGTVDSVLVDFNDRVKKGQVLARLNTDEQHARVLQAQAALEVAKAKVQQIEATVLESDLKLKRCITLSEKGLCPPQDIDIAQATHARAEADKAAALAQVTQAKALLNAEQTRLDKSVIRSPIDGIVLKRQIEPGQTVAASLQAPILFTLAENLTQMELQVAVDEADIGKISEGQKATFSVDAYGEKSFPATLTQIRLAPLTEGGVVSYETILALDNAELLLLPGMTATAHITVQELSNVLQVPNAALRFSPPITESKEEKGFLDQLFPRWGSHNRASRNKGNNKQRRVWVLEQGLPTPIVVVTGASDGQMTHIISGDLQADMQVITDASIPRK